MTSGRPIISFVDAPFRPMLNILARLIFQLIGPVLLILIACPDHFATGDSLSVYQSISHLLNILRQAPEHGLLRLYTVQSRPCWLLYQH